MARRKRAPQPAEDERQLPQLEDLPQERAEAVANEFKILAEPVRVRIAFLLLCRGRSTFEFIMTHISDFDPKEVQYHLNTMREFGIVFRESGTTESGGAAWVLSTEVAKRLMAVMHVVSDMESA